jgi:hypothetical protein
MRLRERLSVEGFSTVGTVGVRGDDRAHSRSLLDALTLPPQAELDAVLPCGEGDDGDGSVSDDWDERVQRASLPLMRQCLRETMRLWPIAAFGVVRTVDCEVRFVCTTHPAPHPAGEARCSSLALWTGFLPRNGRKGMPVPSSSCQCHTTIH